MSKPNECEHNNWGGGLWAVECPKDPRPPVRSDNKVEYVPLEYCKDCGMVRAPVKGGKISYQYPGD
jgi:hypothetical protein